jgi:hypothetical protein
METLATGSMSLHQHSEVYLAINFPNAPANGAIYTEGSVQWQYSSTNNAWTMITTGSPGIDNGVNHDQELVFLDRNGSNQNIPTAGVGFTYDPATRRVAIKGDVAQSTNLFELNNSASTLLNAFNARGILDKAGRVYYQGTQPTVDAADTGQLWYNTSSNTLSIWNGTVWASAGGGVDIASNQVITGAKSFSSATGLTLGSSCPLVGEASLVFKPSGSTKLTLSASEAVFTVPVDFSSVGTNVKNAVVTKADNMTVDGVKTFSQTINASSGLLMNSGTGLSRIFSSTTTDALAVTNSIIIQPSQSATGRYIQLFTNSNENASNGITLRARNENNKGDFNVIGNTKITGNLEISGTFTVPATTATLGATSLGSFKSQSGTNGGNIDTALPGIGALTFTSIYDTTNWNPSLKVTNNSATQVSFYYKREQVGASGYTYGIRKYTLNGNTELTIPLSGSDVSSPVSGFTSSIVCAHTVSIVLLGQTNTPMLVSITLCPA